METMSVNPESLESIKAIKNDPEKGKNQLLSPAPKIKRYVTELLHGFASRKLSFAEITSLHPKKIRQVSEMGFVKLKHGRIKEAIQIFEVLTFIDHKNPFHHLALAGAYQKQKKYVDAIFQYSQTLKLDPKNINALVNRGEIYLRLKNYRKAAEDFREAIINDESGKDRFANRSRSLVIAIKRMLAKDKQQKVPQKEIRATPKKPGPFSLLRTKKQETP
jgi:tetratricopeptide (TPR) repeat protein